MTVYVSNNVFVNLATSRSPEARSLSDGITAGLQAGISQTQYGQERLDSSTGGMSNPPFELAKNRNPLASGTQNKILRGYIRRSDLDAADSTSRYRLYFMYNPETIQRQYMSYLDQASLDPYNTMFGTNNMTAAPAILDFSFSLLFDRQLEVAKDPVHPGTKVDYDFFDLVVRGVVPDTGSDGNAIPDNGVMMLNPRNIAVIFGPELAVHGRPYNAQVSFAKFNNRMTPVRLQIDITMKAFYIGPVSTIPDVNRFSSEQIFKATIPYDESVSYSYTPQDIDISKRLTFDSESSDFQNKYLSSGDGGVAAGGPGSAVDPGTIPGGNVLTGYQMADLVLGIGLRGEGAAIAIAIAHAESSFNPDTENLVYPDHSIGLWQINQLAHKGRFGNDSELHNPARNAAAMMSISSSGGNWKPWSTFTNGKYQNYMAQARGYINSKNGL